MNPDDHPKFIIVAGIKFRRDSGWPNHWRARYPGGTLILWDSSRWSYAHGEFACPFRAGVDPTDAFIQALESVKERLADDYRRTYAEIERLIRKAKET